MTDIRYDAKRNNLPEELKKAIDHDEVQDFIDNVLKKNFQYFMLIARNYDNTTPTEMDGIMASQPGVVVARLTNEDSYNGRLEEMVAKEDVPEDIRRRVTLANMILDVTMAVFNDDEDEMVEFFEALAQASHGAKAMAEIRRSRESRKNRRRRK